MLVIIKLLLNRSRRKYAAVIVIILLVCTGLFFGLEGEKRWYEYYYIVRIEPTDLSTYEVYLPIVVDFANRKYSLMDNLELEGDIDSVEVIASEKGQALRIRARDVIEIYSEMVDAETTFYGDPLEYPERFHLNLIEHSEKDINFHWIYVNITKRYSLDISLRAMMVEGKSGGTIIWMPWEETGGGPTYDIDVALDTNGWSAAAAVEGERILD
jgi:hypothetical protein